MIKQFDEIVTPVFHILKSLQTKQINLRRQRDLLLPRLVSGELDVSELEIAGADSISSDNVVAHEEEYA